MNEIFSYYSKSNGKIIKETLNEHISAALKVVEGINESKIGKYAHTIFPQVKNFSDLVRITVIFHDVGKVFYQKNISEIGEYISFIGHEFFSAYMFNQFFWCSERLLDSEKIFGIDIINPVLFAIIFHHHAMDIAKREEFLKQKHINIQKGTNSFDALFEDIKPFLKDEDKNSFKESLNKVKEKFKNQDEVISGIKRESEETLEKLWKNVWLDRNKKKFSLILLNILLVSDNIAAMRKRGHSTSAFVQALMDFYSFYIGGSEEVFQK